MNQDEQSIREVISDYFLGAYHGNREQLMRAFHPQALISGTINNELHTWSLEQFIQRATTPPIAAEKDAYDKKILWLDITADCATVKAQAFVHGLTFIDYIILLKTNNRWLIRFKSFTSSSA